jgi:hypothetical protein
MPGSSTIAAEGLTREESSALALEAGFQEAGLVASLCR